MLLYFVSKCYTVTYSTVIKLNQQVWLELIQGLFPGIKAGLCHHCLSASRLAYLLSSRCSGLSCSLLDSPSVVSGLSPGLCLFMALLLSPSPSRVILKESMTLLWLGSIHSCHWLHVNLVCNCRVWLAFFQIIHVTILPCVLLRTCVQWSAPPFETRWTLTLYISRVQQWEFSVSMFRTEVQSTGGAIHCT